MEREADTMKTLVHMAAVAAVVSSLGGENHCITGEQLILFPGRPKRW